jgi:hypothetical protein
MLRKCRTCAAVLTLMGLLMASVPAAGAGGGVGREIRESFLMWTWQWIGSLGEKSGGCIDPNGMCKQGGATSPPSHRRRPRPLGEKQGGCIDPDGMCKRDGTNSLPSPPDKGACIDPDGVTCAVF